MDVKLDKETIIKHRFWFSLPCIALCILIGWGCQVNVRSAAYAKFDQADKTVKDLQALSGNADRRTMREAAADNEKPARRMPAGAVNATTISPRK